MNTCLCLAGDDESDTIDVNKQDHQGYTALMIAASLPEQEIGLDICKAILALPDTSMHVRDREGLTALHWAAAQGNPEIVEELVLHKCDVDLYAKPGRRVQPIFREKQRRSGEFAGRVSELNGQNCTIVSVYVCLLLLLSQNISRNSHRSSSYTNKSAM